MKPKGGDVSKMTTEEKTLDPNYYNRADANPGYPKTPFSGLSSEDETLKIRF
jgi:hypothetical protein